jgi:hypothetical protein
MKRHSFRYGLLVWLVWISYSQHISFNQLLVFFSPLGLVPIKYLFSLEGALKPHIGLLVGVFVLEGLALAGIMLLALFSRKRWAHICYWLMTIWFGAVLVLVDMEGKWFTKRLISSWNPRIGVSTSLLFLGSALAGLAVSGLYLFQKRQIGRIRFVTELGFFLIVA